MDTETLSEYIKRRSEEEKLELSDNEIQELSKSISQFGDTSKEFAETCIKLAKASL
jgi:hypothetical protein